VSNLRRVRVLNLSCSELAPTRILTSPKAPNLTSILFVPAGSRTCNFRRIRLATRRSASGHPLHIQGIRATSALPPKRHLAAILAADVAGYSRLMGVDEEGTLAQLKDHRSNLWTPAIESHRGRVGRVYRS
jgi:hypothetical protein